MPISRCWQTRCKQRLYGGVGGDCHGYHFSRGMFFRFGATDKISVVTENLHALPPVVILRLRNMTALDATGLFALEEVAKSLHASKRTLILCGAREQPAQLIHQREFAEVVGKENICDNVQAALRRAEEVCEGLDAKFVVSKS